MATNYSRSMAFHKNMKIWCQCHYMVHVVIFRDLLVKEKGGPSCFCSMDRALDRRALGLTLVKGIYRGCRLGRQLINVSLLLSYIDVSHSLFPLFFPHCPPPTPKKKKKKRRGWKCQNNLCKHSLCNLLLFVFTFPLVA